MVIAGGADDQLISAVGYWRREGISIDCLPYRIYELPGEPCFELFALWQAQESRRREGVQFDTDQAYDEASIW